MTAVTCVGGSAVTPCHMSTGVRYHVSVGRNK